MLQALGWLASIIRGSVGLKIVWVRTMSCMPSLILGM